MYYEEKIISGVMHYRTSPEGKWVAYTIEEISRRYAAAQAEEQKWKDRADKYKWQVRDICTRAEKAEAEARELRQSRRDAIDMANDNAVLAAEAMKERNELQAELARVRELVTEFANFARDSGWINVAEELERNLALSQPAEPKPGSDLPLMARRPRMHRNHSLAYIVEDKLYSCCPSEWTPPVGCDVYRIADTDEHGLPVVERTPDMPEGAKYRSKQIGSDGWVYHAKYAGAYGYDWRRIEDYIAEPAQREGS